MAVIDTSAFMSTAALEMIAGERVRMSTTHTVTVEECDAAIQAGSALQIMLCPERAA